MVLPVIAARCRRRVAH